MAKPLCIGNEANYLQSTGWFKRVWFTPTRRQAQHAPTQPGWLHFSRSSVTAAPRPDGGVWRGLEGLGRVQRGSEYCWCSSASAARDSHSHRKVEAGVCRWRRCCLKWLPWIPSSSWMGISHTHLLHQLFVQLLPWQHRFGFGMSPQGSPAHQLWGGKQPGEGSWGASLAENRCAGLAMGQSNIWMFVSSSLKVLPTGWWVVQADHGHTWAQAHTSGCRCLPSPRDFHSITVEKAELEKIRINHAPIHPIFKKRKKPSTAGRALRLPPASNLRAFRGDDAETAAPGNHPVASSTMDHRF